MESLRRWLYRWRKKNDVPPTLPYVRTGTTTSPASDHYAMLRRLLDTVTVAQFRDELNRLPGREGKLPEEDFDYLYGLYRRALDGEGYNRVLVLYKRALTASINLLRARLIVSLPYGAMEGYYREFGLGRDPIRNRSRIKELVRVAEEAQREYEEAVKVQEPEPSARDSTVTPFALELSAVSRRLGFAIDPDKMAIGVYLGYLELIAAEDRNRSKKGK